MSDYTGYIMKRNAKMAVVDDNELTRGLLVDVLMFCVNRKVLVFENALSAWNHFEKEGQPDLILSDVNMSEMTGLELLVRIKKKSPKTICVMMSGDRSSEEMARDLGADAFLAKPFNISDLFQIVQTFVVGDG
ncbi:MAG: response regulator [Deltaproteobacteria bacterium]|nr:response regulator [Deltaproteobacteria bacterium]